MNDIIHRPDLTWREKLAYLGYSMLQMGGSNGGECPVKHSFEGDKYVREIFVPAGTVFVGRPHRTGHRIVGVSGHVVLHVNGEQMEFDGSFELVTSPGTQIAAHAVTDHVARTYHSNPSGSRDADECELAAFHAPEEVLQLGREVSARLEESECLAYLPH